ncbi:MAG: hypothetical protein PVG24_05290 [Gammaproteobacteria bacterium]|jgi:hypothetical protein
MFNRRVLLRVALAGALLTVPMAAQATDGASDKLGKGPEIGAPIPHSLAATDQNGKAQDFASLKGERGLVLLFARSLGW